MKRSQRHSEGAVGKLAWGLCEAGSLELPDMGTPFLGDGWEAQSHLRECRTAVFGTSIVFLVNQGGSSVPGFVPVAFVGTVWDFHMSGRQRKLCPAISYSF